MIFEEERKQVAQIMRRLYERGLTTLSGGNVSLKNPEGVILITASQCDKSCINESKIAVLDTHFNNLTPELKPSMETEMHLKIYEKRPDIFAIIHSHPVYATTFAVSKIKLDTSVTEEAGYIVGDVAIIEHKIVGSSELAQACADSLTLYNTGLMKNHGAIAVGNNLTEAFGRIEVLEFTARVCFNTMMLGLASL
jgi:L-fuculose-phosphate aldolase